MTDSDTDINPQKKLHGPYRAIEVLPISAPDTDLIPLINFILFRYFGTKLGERELLLAVEDWKRLQIP